MPTQNKASILDFKVRICIQLARPIYSHLRDPSTITHKGYRVFLEREMT